MALDYLFAKPSANVNYAANTAVSFNTVISQASGSVLSLSSGSVAGLKANTSYLVLAGMSVSHNAGSSNDVYARLWNTTAAAAFGPGVRNSGRVTSNSYNGNVYPYTAAIIRPGVTTSVSLRQTSRTGSGTSAVLSDSWIMVIELPSTMSTICAYAGSNHSFSAGNPVQIDTEYQRNGIAALNAYGVDLTAGHTYLIFGQVGMTCSVTANATCTFVLYDRTGAAVLPGTTTTEITENGTSSSGTNSGQLLVGVFKPTVNSTVELRMNTVASGTWTMLANDCSLTVVDLGNPQTGSDRDFILTNPTQVSSSGLPAISAAGTRVSGKLYPSSSNIVDFKPDSLYLALCRPNSTFGSADFYTYAFRDNASTIGTIGRPVARTVNSNSGPAPMAAALLDVAALAVSAPDTYDNLRMKYLSQSGNPDFLLSTSDIFVVELYGSVQREPYVYSFSPAIASSLAGSDAVEFKIERPFDDFYSIAIVVDAIWADYTGAGESELIYSDGAFKGLYAADSTVTPTTLGNTYHVERDTGWRGDFTLHFKVHSVDYQNDRVFDPLLATADYDAPNNPPRDSVVPVVDTFSPATGSTVAPTGTLAFHVTDIGTALIGRKVIWATYATGLKEIIYDGSAFTAHYDAASTVGVIANGYAFVLAREGGWIPGAITLYFEIYDTDGNQAAPASAAYTISGSILPTIASFSPALLSTIDQNDTIGFTISSPNSIALALEEISVSYAGTSIDEAVFKNGAFCAKYDTAPNARTVNSASNHAYVVRREGGWPGSPTFRFVVTDADGNAGTPTSGAFTLSGAILPVVALTPVAGSTIIVSDSIQIDVTSELNTLSLEEIYVLYTDTSVQETVYGAGAFGPKFANSPNAKNSISSAHHVFTVRRDGGWLSSPHFKFVFTDADGNRSSTTTANYTIVASSAPVVNNLDPEDGATLEFVDDTVSLDVTDYGGLSSILLTVHYTGIDVMETVYQDGDFWGPYNNVDAEQTAITNGYNFVFNRAEGWLDDFTLYWVVTDTDGQVTTGSADFIVQAGAITEAPYVSDLDPPDLSDLERMQPVTFDVNDLNPGLGYVFIWMKYSGDTDYTMIYDNSAFLGTFFRESTRDANSFSILPAGGWLRPVTSLRIRLIDSKGTIDVEV